jgi:hypothetical protein
MAETNPKFVTSPLAPFTMPNPSTPLGAVTPSDITVFAIPTRGLYIGGAGNVAVTMGGVVVLFTAVPVGTFMNIAVTKVMATNTTATLITALN